MGDNSIFSVFSNIWSLAHFEMSRFFWVEIYICFHRRNSIGSIKITVFTLSGKLWIRVLFGSTKDYKIDIIAASPLN
jgi:hypothetical protein